MLKAALSGGYVNFGVFNLYGDEALNNSLNMFVKLAFSIPRKDILVSQLGLVVRRLDSAIQRIVIFSSFLKQLVN